MSDTECHIQEIGSQTAKVVCIGLNPAYQKTLTLKNFKPGQVNRVIKVQKGVGGKGQNSSIVFRKHSNKDIILVQIIGGNNGRDVTLRLEQQGVSNIISFVLPSWETRVCNTILGIDDKEQNCMTEIIEPTEPLLRQHQEWIYKEIETVAAKVSPCQVLLICGTCPEGLSSDEAYYKFVVNVKKNNPDCFVMVDSFKSMNRLLNSGLIDLLKINTEEALILSGSSEITYSQDQVLLAIEKLYSLYKLNMVAVTGGELPSFFFTSKHNAHRFSVPDLNQIIATSDGKYVINPLGAGDTVNGTFVAKILDQDLKAESFIEAFRYALEMASIHCLYQVDDSAQAKIDSKHFHIDIDKVK